jgi:predicted site-specific integrase-resolvase
MIVKRYKAKDVCNILGISRKTLERMIKNKEINYILEKNRYYFSEEELLKFNGISLGRSKNRGVYLYSRVSSSKQKNELKTQQELLEAFANSNGYVIKEHFSDISSGMNFNRPNFNKLISLVVEGNVSLIIVSYQDRLARFAFDLIKFICKLFNTEILIINNKETSPQQELVEDLMTIIHVFSSRLYGLRRNTKKIKEFLE